MDFAVLHQEQGAGCFGPCRLSRGNRRPEL